MPRDYKKMLVKHVKIPEDKPMEFRRIVDEKRPLDGSVHLQQMGMRYGRVRISDVEMEETVDVSEARAKLFAGDVLPLVLLQDKRGYRVLVGGERVVVAKQEGREEIEAFIIPEAAVINVQKLQQDLESFFKGVRSEVSPVVNIPVSLIKVEGQIRKDMDPEGLKELAESIERVGLINPVTVKREGDGYTVVAGHRRFFAVRDILKWDRISCRVLEEDRNTAFVQFSENVHRKDLHPVEVAEVVGKVVVREVAASLFLTSGKTEMLSQIVDSKGKTEDIFIPENIWRWFVAKEFLRKDRLLSEEGKAVVARLLREFGISRMLLSVSVFIFLLPEAVKKELAQYDLKPGHYYELINRGVTDPEIILAVAKAVHEKGMTVAELRAYLKRLATPRAKVMGTREEKFMKRVYKFGETINKSRLLKSNPALRQRVVEYLKKLLAELEGF